VSGYPQPLPAIPLTLGDDDATFYLRSFGLSLQRSQVGSEFGEQPSATEHKFLPSLLQQPRFTCVCVFSLLLTLSPAPIFYLFEFGCGSCCDANEKEQ
jgi:hypothetical protein